MTKLAELLRGALKCRGGAEMAAEHQCRQYLGTLVLLLATWISRRVYPAKERDIEYYSQGINI